MANFDKGTKKVEVNAEKCRNYVEAWAEKKIKLKENMTSLKMMEKVKTARSPRENWIKTSSLAAKITKCAFSVRNFQANRLTSK